MLSLEEICCIQVEDTDEHIKTTIKAGGLMDVVRSLLQSQLEGYKTCHDIYAYQVCVLKAGHAYCRWSATPGYVTSWPVIHQYDTLQEKDLAWHTIKWHHSMSQQIAYTRSRCPNDSSATDSTSSRTGPGSTMPTGQL